VTVSLSIRARIPLGPGVQAAVDLATLAKDLRRHLAPIQWAALERLALAVVAEASVDRETRELALRVAD